MKHSFFHKTRLGIAFYTATLVAVAVTSKSMWLALGAVLTGILFLWIIKRSLHIRTTDERTSLIAGKAAGMAFSVIVTSLAVFSLLFLIGFSHIPYLKSLGIIFSYLTCLMVGLYSLFYMLYDKQS